MLSVIPPLSSQLTHNYFFLLCNDLEMRERKAALDIWELAWRSLVLIAGQWVLMLGTNSLPRHQDHTRSLGNHDEMRSKTQDQFIFFLADKNRAGVQTTEH